MLLPADQEVRDQALSPGRSFHLEAPAGSGKTSVLLARFLSLLARVEAPEELLALTFTRKAAGELRTRVMQLLWERE
ncbi:MAG TPA: UvrD-helicase domain-containing protein, partial [Desulfobaccales bacterium]